VCTKFWLESLKRPIERRECKWKDNIKREISLEDVDWNHLAEDRDWWQALLNAEMNLGVP
jgi:hypothetical protein